MKCFLLGLLVPFALTAEAVADVPSCTFKENALDNNLEAATLVVRLENPPRSRVVLSVDEQVTGLHRELVWDPTVGDGLQHDLILEKGTYKLTAFADDNRIQTSQIVVLTTTRFKTAEGANDPTKATMPSTEVSIAITNNGKPETFEFKNPNDTAPLPTPKLQLACNSARLNIGSLRLNTKKLVAASVVRGFLDDTVPKAVDDTLTLLAEIALERAKSGALELVRSQFVVPICERLSLATLHLGASSEQAFPRTCALLLHIRLEDVLSSGQSLVEAARDDVMLTIVPTLIEHVDLPQSARDLATIALGLANKMLEDGGADGTDLDLVLSQLDRLFFRGAAAGIGDFKILFAVTLPENERVALIERALENVIPDDPGAAVSPYAPKTPALTALAKEFPIGSTLACQRPKDTKKTYVASDREKCIHALAQHVATQDGWNQRAAKWLSPEKWQLPAPSAYAAWLQGAILNRSNALLLTTKSASQIVRLACGVRVSLAILKWCSGRDACTATDVANAFDRPEALLVRDPTDPRDSVCWEDPDHDPTTPDDILRLPTVRTQYIDLTARALGFLQPPRKGEERKRIGAMLRWTFDLAKTIEDSTGTSRLAKLEDILEQIVSGDYVRGISQAMVFATEVYCNDKDQCTMPKGLEKAAKLLGSVASYVQVYDDTKTLDAAEAKAARKKALESLIDASTDRKGRAGDVIYGLGAPIGFSAMRRWAPGDRTRAYTSELDAYDLDAKLAFGFRFPLALVRQTMPHHDAWPCGFPWGWRRGWHLALTFADLGNFVRSTPDDADKAQDSNEKDKLRWKDFLQLGVQAGILLGNGRHSVILALDASWSPSLNERAVSIEEDGDSTMKRVSGALNVGITLAYYVPFLDFN
jgi:hypothetical protein